ncbi:MAG: 3',5'-cyclic-AMP phosphodiesterase [Pseudomonadales bacterium]|nr:3',5'-cyclic-AMP phosphodiesterase [Pseudomonadales bacterium]
MSISTDKKATRVVQISDCHLFKDTEGKLLGINTQSSFELVMALVRAEQKEIDLFLCTGDLSQDSSPEAYQRFHNAITAFGKPAYWLSGNHDVVSVMQGVLKDKSKLSPCVIELESWHIIMLDTSIRNKVPGRLEKVQLDFLDASLAAAASKGKHVMVCLHHHPIPMNSQWLDGVALENPQDFFAIIDRYKQVKTIVWGHVHQEFDGTRNNVRMLSLPSTCAQFKPLSDEFAADDKSPGYRWFDLNADGSIVTGVSRVVGVTFEVDYSVKGY